MLYDDDVHVLAFNGNKLKLHLVFPGLEPPPSDRPANRQSGSGSGPDQDRVRIRIRSGSGLGWGSGLGGDRVWVCRGSGLVCRWFLVLSRVASRMFVAKSSF